jgi:hypothetical protein
MIQFEAFDEQRSKTKEFVHTPEPKCRCPVRHSSISVFELFQGGSTGSRPKASHSPLLLFQRAPDLKTVRKP